MLFLYLYSSRQSAKVERAKAKTCRLTAFSASAMHGLALCRSLFDVRLKPWPTAFLTRPRIGPWAISGAHILFTDRVRDDGPWCQFLTISYITAYGIWPLAVSSLYPSLSARSRTYHWAAPNHWVPAVQRHVLHEKAGFLQRASAAGFPW